VVRNDASLRSREIAEYYLRRRAIPLANLCAIRAPDNERISRTEYRSTVEAPVLRCAAARPAILAIVLTQGVPLRILPSPGAQPRTTDAASVDSELAGVKLAGNGPATNPYFRRRDAGFDRSRFPMFLVLRLAAFTVSDVKRAMERSLEAGRTPGLAARGKVVIDMRNDSDDGPGDGWLRDAAIKLPDDRVIFDQSAKVVEGVQRVIAYAGWGSNDKNRKSRRLGFGWLPGGVYTEYVSTNARTFAQPPASWKILGTWSDPSTWFDGAPQSLTADAIADGASAATGHVDEPFLDATPRPEELLPAYLLRGRTLAEAYYLSIPYLSWMNICVGDPLMRLGR
jgi:uncharacterized protein (TIGR03790 family)